MPTDRRREAGPFDIIGDVHGCASELEDLLAQLGYVVSYEGVGADRRVYVDPPAGRRAIFVGDLVDRGPRSADVLRIVLEMTRRGSALLVPGNHDVKFLRWLKGENVSVTHGLDATVRDVSKETDQFRSDVTDLLQGLWSHVWVDGGALVVAHAGIKEAMIGRATPRVRRFCLYGDTSGEKDDYGLPVRYHWALGYRGETAVVYGHTPVPAAEWVANTLCVDTGCCFGGRLTALRWPEREIVSVPARETYARPIRPFGHPRARPPGV
ncbi:MAG: metallophosphoesterase [Hyphomicrobiaceae bacterium]|nr:metallophosphoesterase [Hyphomicrobiaceae bacterium]